MTPDLTSILADVRLAVIHGNYTRVQELLPILKAAEPSAPGLSSDELQNLRVEAVRTGACLQAALAGFRSARRRMAEITEAARGLTTYDRDGTKAIVSSVLPDSRRV